MTTNNDIDENAKSFWAAFRMLHKSLRQLPDNEIAEQVQKTASEYFGAIGVEVSCDSQSREIIFTACGDKDKFNDIRRLVSRAPQLPDWTFTALKPRRGFKFSLSIDHVTVYPSHLRFVSLQSSSSPNQIGIRVFAPACISGRNDGDDIIWMIVEIGIGEEAASEVSYIEVRPDTESPNDAFAIESLEKYVEWAKNSHK